MCTLRILAQNVSNMALRQKCSKVWLYFTKKDNTRASCNTCRAVITSKGGNTSNMLKHLTTQHAITLHKCKVVDTLLSGGGNSCLGACGTASSISKVSGKQGSQMLARFCHWKPKNKPEKSYSKHSIYYWSQVLCKSGIQGLFCVCLHAHWFELHMLRGTVIKGVPGDRVVVLKCVCVKKENW